MTSEFPAITFAGKLRPSQADVAAIAQEQLGRGEKKLHIVAPPGSGKTVLGLYLWAHYVRRPALALSPNSAIQSQWAARTDLFHFPLDRREFVSTDPKNPSLLTSLTYQSVTLPARRHDPIGTQAIELWCDRLIESQQVTNEDEAKRWIDELKQHNVEYHNRRLSAYSKQIRDELAKTGDSTQMLHASSRQTLQRLREQGVGLIILDECHHLLGHWGRVLADALELLNQPVVIGLTATPPDRDGIDARDLKRYDEFFGQIDYEVPVPAVVKDGYLAPYQDLAYFVRPTDDELKFIASSDRRLREIVDDLCKPFEHESQTELRDSRPFPTGGRRDDDSLADSPCLNHPPAKLNLPQWLAHVLRQRQLPTGTAKNWRSFEKRDQQFAVAARQFLISRGRRLPDGVPSLGPLETPNQVPAIEVWTCVLDRYVRHYLRRSPDDDLKERGEKIVSSLRLLGLQITETGTRACASPVGRVIAYSNSKAAALIPILATEQRILGNQIRAVVVTDFEKTSAVSEEINHLLDEETGGAIAAFKAIVSNPRTDTLDPILVTGSTILLDGEIESSFLQASERWLDEKSLAAELTAARVADFVQITGRGRDWSPRTYIEMITEHFQNGLTRCLVGTRGLLGEGWDANRINVLVDLTTVTTSMSINQLRGRSIRLDPRAPEKLANNWDVVCIAPEFSKGFDDYHRFIAKHRNLYGVTDDGSIEKGVGHVHPAFTEIKPEGLEGSFQLLNDEMLARAAWRKKIRDHWNIGQPYQAQPIKAVDLKMPQPGGFPPFSGRHDTWTDDSLTEAISNAVLSSLIEVGEIPFRTRAAVGKLAGGYIRVFLKSADERDNEIFAKAMSEVLGPIDNPRYLIERTVEIRSDGFLSSVLPHVIGKYLKKKRREIAMLHAVPSILATKREIVDIFQRYWNRFVGPGRAVYTHRGEGAELVEKAKRDSSSGVTHLHNREIFR